MTTTTTSLGPEFTPTTIKRIISLTCILSIGCVITEAIFTQILKIPGPLAFLGLSWWGISNFFIWQPLSYLFVYGSPGAPISLFWIIGLFFNMYILWIMGTFVLDLIGEKSFLKLYFGSGIFAALITLLSMPLFGQYTALSGPAAAVLAVLTVWTMFNPESQLMLFFILPIKAKWLVITAIGIIALINFTNLNFISIIYYLSGATFGYCYSVIAWGLQSPFPITHRFDETLTRFSHPWAHNSSGKIIDLAKARKMQKNEEFMDEMLEKISKHGKDSLSWWEKRKMRKISETKNGK